MLSPTADKRTGFLFAVNPNGALYDAVNHGTVDAERLRQVLAGLPLPRMSRPGFSGGSELPR